MHARTTALIASTIALAPAFAHEGGADEHLLVGYYNGHDGSFEAPAVPPLPDTLLIDTHPWELGPVHWGMGERSTSPLLGDGWITDIPGFDSLPVEDQEFNGHGFFTVLGTSARVALELVSISPGLEVLRADQSAMVSGDRVTLGVAPFGVHPTYFVSDAAGLHPGAVVTAVFRLVDLNGGMLTSEDFEVKHIVGGRCNLADVAAPFRVMNVNDAIDFVNAFAAGNALADIAPEGGDDAYDVNDIVTFVNNFNAGCP